MTRDYFFQATLKVLRHPLTFLLLGLFWLSTAALSAPIFRDEGLWGYMARLWIHYRLPPYVGSLENKTPGIIFLFTLSDLLFGQQYWFTRLLGIFFMSGTALILYRIGKTWWDHSTGLLAMTVFLLSSAWWSFEGPYAAQTESFMNFFTVLAFYEITLIHAEGEGRPSKRALMAGFFMGWAIAFKQIAVISAAALFLFTAQNGGSDRSQQKPRQRLLALGSGIILATALSILPLLISGVSFHDYFQGAWLLLMKHGEFASNAAIGHVWGSYAPWGERILKFRRVALPRIDTMVFPVSLFYLYWKRKKLEDRRVPVLGLMTWMICDAIGVHASGNYFTHQFKQILPSLSLAIALSARQFFEDLPLSDAHTKDLGLLGTAWILAILMSGSPQMPTVSRAYRNFTHPMAISEKSLGQWLKAHTQPADYIYVLGKESDLVQYYSDRRSSSKYMNAYFIDANAIPGVTQDLSALHPPRFIVLSNNQAPDWMWKVIAGNAFTHTLTENNYWIYENRNFLPQR